MSESHHRVASAAMRVRAIPRAATRGGDVVAEVDVTAIAMGSPSNLKVTMTPVMRMSRRVKVRTAQSRNYANVVSASDPDKRALLPVRSSMRMASSLS